MGFLTKEDFELLSQWGNRYYDKTNPKHQEAREGLGKIYQKIKEIGVAIYQDKFKITKSPLEQSGRFKKYNWGRFHPIEDDERLCLTISMDESKHYAVKIDIAHNNKDLTKEQLTAYERLRAENFERIVHKFDTSKILGLDKEELINLTKEHLDELKHEWDWVYQHVFGSTPSPPPSLLSSLNTILYGPPGTGKTYKLMKEYFRQFTSTKKKTKEEFIKSEVANANLGWFRSIALAMLDLDQAVTVPELRQHPVMEYRIKNSSSKSVSQICWMHLQLHTPT